MPTMVGLGFSTKVPASEHTLDNHMRWMNSVLKTLALTEVVFVGQDWGGPVGMGALSLSPDVLKGAVVMNRVPMDLSRVCAGENTAGRRTAGRGDVSSILHASGRGAG